MSLLTQEHELVRKTARDFAEKYVGPIARRMDRENYYPRDILRDAGKLGILTPTVPPEYGGGGGDLRSVVVILEELGRVSGGFSLLVEAYGVLFADALKNFGSAGQKEEVLPKVAAGEKIGAFALSEPCCGSDAAAIQTRAERRGGEWVINGAKMWITNGLYADYYLVAARTGPREARHKAITVFLLRRSSCVEASPIEVMGVRGTGTAELKFNDCSVGEDEIVGELNGGWRVLMHTLDVGRVAISGVALGIARGAFEEALAWARSRELFGKRLVEFQNAQFELAEMLASIETARALTYYAAYLYDVGSPEFLLMSHVAKLQAARLAVDVTRRAVQMEGGYGYSKESKAEMFYRDAKILEIGEGTNEVMKYVIYKLLEKSS
ncbi:acyl-CoA dehydrogenase family protein [Thermoproteus tenax]|uniref:Acyl-CoA dehydrogenase n=1 Tax=Thermoproteus tenax (strain ATCC 35583 / DSM 2078 / JCM 9277 / NBRC 100435 / Kra 1) TaxID=768679 RepID=G4RNU1_THETK|nr:acyl-CoA dehydrogenase family protein [Thermoproteus tenax]CCC81235.1 acyl-CoA dehydrogenase [Thermoproteus tenax Kra 1]